ncbi:LysE family translocator [Spongiimicrobium sp. 3-5]|uniref:LysE family translocator n=1 Tax=Spongiimicrobium sp. 3-5 TaxID=3332596 RepID=UPI00398044DE
MDYEIIYAFMLASTALAIAPGPDNIYVLVQSVASGKKYGIATVAGLVSGCLVHTTLLAFGLSAIIKESDGLFLLIKLLGAAYLVYLAYSVYRAESSIILTNTEVSQKNLWQMFKKGFIMNVLNPKVTIFFLAFFPSFLFSDTLNTALQFYVLGALFMLIAFTVFSLIAILASSITSYIRRNSKIGVVMKWLQISVFLGIAVFILLSDK